MDSPWVITFVMAIFVVAIVTAFNFVFYIIPMDKKIEVLNETLSYKIDKIGRDIKLLETNVGTKLESVNQTVLNKVASLNESVKKEIRSINENITFFEEVPPSIRVASLGKPGMVLIVSNYTIAVSMPKFTVNKTSEEILIDDNERINRTFNFPSAGSGFVVNTNGFIATNSHVVAIDKLATFNEVIDLIKKLVVLKEVLTSILTPSDSGNSSSQINNVNNFTVYNFSTVYFDIQKEYEDSRNSLKENHNILGVYSLGSTDIFEKIDEIISKSTADTVKSIVVYQGGLRKETALLEWGRITRMNDSNPLTESFGGDDAAIIKINASNLYTIKLGDTEGGVVGESVFAVGYPYVIGFNLSQDLTIVKPLDLPEPSVTAGIISAKRKSYDNFTLLQSDVFITFGNSGGPSFDDQAKAIGISTYGYEDPLSSQQISGINFLVSIDRIREKMEKLNITNDRGEISLKYEKAVKNFWKKDYNIALQNFLEIKTLLPNDLYVNGYIDSLNIQLRGSIFGDMGQLINQILKAFNLVK